MSQRKILNYRKKDINEYEKLREKYKRDYNSFIDRMEKQGNTIQFREIDSRERM